MPELPCQSELSHRARGNRGEELAQTLLERAGYLIIDTNVHFGPKSGLKGELDIIAWEGDVLCFIEVKTRLSGNAVPLEAITPHKQRQMTQLALAYITRHGLGDSSSDNNAEEISMRFDAIGLLLSSDGAYIRRHTLVRGAFMMELESLGNSEW
jgi:putative endonuclease